MAGAAYGTPERNIGGLLDRLSVVRRVNVGRPLVRYRAERGKILMLLISLLIIRDTIKVPEISTPDRHPERRPLHPQKVGRVICKNIASTALVTTAIL
jgi:hypothetical protein